jgi:hypothetical protein
VFLYFKNGKENKPERKIKNKRKKSKNREGETDPPPPRNEIRG